MAMAINPVKIFGADGRLKKIIDGQSDKEILSSGIAHYNAQNPQKPVTQKMLKNLDLLKGKLEEPKNSRWTKEMDAKVISWMLHTDTTSGKKIAEELQQKAGTTVKITRSDYKEQINYYKSLVGFKCQPC